MAQFNGLTLTAAGIEMISQSQGAGTALIFTNFKLGSGQLAENENIKTLNKLKQEMLIAPVHSFTETANGQVDITAIVNNSEVKNGFFARELGIFAKLGNDGKEKMYAYTNCGNYADYIPDNSTPINEDEIQVSLVIGEAKEVNAIIDTSITYITKLEFQKEMAHHNTSEDAHANIIASLQEQVKKSGLNLLSRSKTYAVGDIAYSASLPTWARLECVTAGTTAATEPDFSSISQAGVYLTDGTVTWIVDDARDATPVGAVSGRLYLPAGYIKANGATVQRADYPRLVALATAHSLWTSDTAANCGLFGVGDGSTTMVLPNWVGRMAQFAATAGATVAAGLPNIVGRIAMRYGVIKGEASGAFSVSAGEDNTSSTYTGSQPASYFSFNAGSSNAIYGNSTTVQPPAIQLIPQIKY